MWILWWVSTTSNKKEEAFFLMIRIPGGSKCLVSFARIAEILDQHQQEAPGIIVCYNHPSGSVEPGPEDIQVTERLVSAGQMLEIELRDYIIQGDCSPCFCSVLKSVFAKFTYWVILPLVARLYSCIPI